MSMGKEFRKYTFSMTTTVMNASSKRIAVSSTPKSQSVLVTQRSCGSVNGGFEEQVKIASDEDPGVGQ